MKTLGILQHPPVNSRFRPVCGRCGVELSAPWKLGTAPECGPCAGDLYDGAPAYARGIECSRLRGPVFHKVRAGLSGAPTPECFAHELARDGRDLRDDPLAATVEVSAARNGAAIRALRADRAALGIDRGIGRDLLGAVGEAAAAFAVAAAVGVALGALAVALGIL